MDLLLAAVATVLLFFAVAASALMARAGGSRNNYRGHLRSILTILVLMDLLFLVVLVGWYALRS